VCINKVVVVRRLLTRKSLVQSCVVHVRLVVNKVAPGLDFSEYLGFPAQSSIHQTSITLVSTLIVMGWYNTSF